MFDFLKRRIRRPAPPRTLGLALSGGGVRGMAHIGVLKVLEREQIPISFIAGTSAGGLVAALYAAGLSAAEIEAEALNLVSPRRLVALIDYTVPRRGLLAGRKVTEYLARWLGRVTFEQLRTPLALVAVDLEAGEKVVLRHGPVLDAVRATIALPGLFAPVEQAGRTLVDGGLLDNLPTDVVCQMGAEVVLAVDIARDEAALAPLTDGLRRNRLAPAGLISLVDVLWRSVTTVTKEVNHHVLAENPPDLLLQPAIHPEVTILTGFHRAAETIAAGEQAAEEGLEELRRLMEG